MHMYVYIISFYLNVIIHIGENTFIKQLQLYFDSLPILDGRIFDGQIFESSSKIRKGRNTTAIALQLFFSSLIYS